MAFNKNAIIRYRTLDKCFSDLTKDYSFIDLHKACNDALFEHTGIRRVSERQLYEDIKFMKSKAGYSIKLENEGEKGAKKYYRYADIHFSITKQPISPAEIEQLQNTLVMLNRFKGLPQFEWMEEVLVRFEDSFSLKTNIDKVVDFEQNPYLKGLNYFTDIFNAIVRKKALQIRYRANFGPSDEYLFHPYYLKKQYNNRWFVFGLVENCDGDRIMNMAIDRIDDFEEISITYIENKTIDFSEYFDDVVGVSVPQKEVQPQLILLRVDKSEYNYIESKPLHHSQKVKEVAEDFVTISLNLISNYEFETLLLGFANKVEILSPIWLRKKILTRAQDIFKLNS